MKKLLSVLLLALALVGLVACGNEATEDPAPEVSAEETPSPAPEADVDDETPAEDASEGFVTVFDFDGPVEVMQNPTSVAIFDYSVLDLLYQVGFARTGIETLILPTVDTLPDHFAWFQEQQDITIATGGTLFYVDWDVMDLLQPELVILGGRSFGMDVAGNRLSPEEVAEFRDETEARYDETAFLNMRTQVQVAAVLEDMTRNAVALAQIFPDLADDLLNRVSAITAEVENIRAEVTQLESRALMVSTGSPTNMSVFLANSRYSMIYDEFGFLPVQDEPIEWTDQHGFDVRAEFVLETNPDVIFLLDRSEVVGTGPGADNFLNDPIIQMTDAYQNGNIIIVGGEAWYTITTGFFGLETMIADVRSFLDNL